MFRFNGMLHRMNDRATPEEEKRFEKCMGNHMKNGRNKCA